MAKETLAGMLESWLIALRAEGKSRNTVKVYGDGIRSYIRWGGQSGPGDLSRESVSAFLAWLMDVQSATTAGNRAKVLKLFSAWAHEEGITGSDELASVRPPRPDKTVVPKLSDEELKDLIDTCAAEKTMYGRRDEAMVRLCAECGCRAEELLGMNLPGDLDLKRGIAVIRKGKGAKGRLVGFGPQTARSIDRYLRERRKFGMPDDGPLWVSQRKGRIGYHGLYATLLKRAEAAGIANFHPHRLRHTFASRWRRAGGSESGLMAAAGWTSLEMVQRYTEDSKSELAMEESRRLSLGDI